MSYENNQRIAKKMSNAFAEIEIAKTERVREKETEKALLQGTPVAYVEAWLSSEDKVLSRGELLTTLDSYESATTQMALSYKDHLHSSQYAAQQYKYMQETLRDITVAKETLQS